MTRKHDAIFDDVLSGLDAPAPAGGERAGARFLKRSTAISERMSGELEEKTLRWVDPGRCRMWDRHNRDYALLTEDNCRDLIDGIRSQGRQEFPAIVRPSSDPAFDYEVICGARRHFAVSWLAWNNYTQFKYLIEVRDLSDEEAFRLADIENRDREDISDYERAMDYADAVERYYGGRQKAMAERLEVSQPWLSRYLQLAKLPSEVVRAFPSIRDIKERNARDLKPLLSDPDTAPLVLAEARKIAETQAKAADGQGGYVDGLAVVRRLVKAGKPARVAVDGKADSEDGVSLRKRGRKVVMEFSADIPERELRAAVEAFLTTR
ncbi:ParB/RepB/Spo0J family partition protein [Pseudoprimorskyibacter insulae]|uniref:Nucleoid occlusion protein n=1 Tax=Pseudoprimorskyibacter insulae TaxID=1695997 RepID=A0A2R8B031_9RHOB|nr:ParB/RepB/Spo0J family partition protein [Pseudoprimorskyibacter insulae]SPF81655.1 Nucleoid occlusion protein [Pseudoprimorskyibacter insulae]